MSHLSSDNVVSLHVIILSADFFRGRYEVIDEFRKSLWTNVIIVWKPGEVEAIFVNYTQNQIRIPSGPALSVCIKSNLILIGLITITAVKTKWIPKNRFRNKYLDFIFLGLPKPCLPITIPSRRFRRSWRTWRFKSSDPFFRWLWICWFSEWIYWWWSTVSIRRLWISWSFYSSITNIWRIIIFWLKPDCFHSRRISVVRFSNLIVWTCKKDLFSGVWNQNSGS